MTSPDPHPDEPRPGELRGPAAEVLSAAGFACAAVALLYLPIAFGLAGILLGIAGHARGEALGRWAAVGAAAAMAAGTALGALLAA
ncbi:MULTISPECIES: hypothetical protein [Nonomuraea]|uniref:DUF4190 domain-containing protein n=2 Tax=Nonomuraea TaxID=83681 RepID=A0ABW1BPY4_9ACTN|nr:MULTISPECIES: hypothetical protein [Nonomuraea]MDA0645183.1 hypothetical protein [Nonomuraea ferruginea]TXK41120.1 hypothetical protein FR742_17465 [Nonomuraea sp. C10]